MNTHSAGGHFAIISIIGLAITTWVAEHSAFLSGVASIATSGAAIVSIYLSLRKKRKG